MKLYGGLKPSQFGMVVHTALLTGCFAGPGFLKQNESFQLQQANVQMESLGEISQGTVSATSMTTQTLAASAGSSLAGVKLSVQPGTFAIDANIALEESADLADGNMSQNLGVTLTQTAGKAVSITAQGFGSSELTKPMTLAIPLASTGLMLADSDNILVIVYRTYKDGLTLDGILTPDKITIRNGEAIFDIIRWGAYQPAYVPKSEEAKVAAVQEVKTEAKILTATVMKELPQATISALTITKGDNHSVAFSATLSNADISRCYVDAYDTQSSEREFEEIGTPTKVFDFSGDYEAMKYMVRIGCVLVDGRVLETAYTLFELPAIDKPGTSSPEPSPTTPSGNSSCDYTNNYPCSEGLVSVWFTDDTGAATANLNAGQVGYVYAEFIAGFSLDVSNTPDNTTNFCWHVPSVIQPLSRMGTCGNAWETVSGNTYRRAFTPHYRGVNGMYELAYLSFRDAAGRYYAYGTDSYNAATYSGSTITVPRFTYFTANSTPDLEAPTLTNINASSSIMISYDDYLNTDQLRMACVTIAAADNSYEYNHCLATRGPYSLSLPGNVNEWNTILGAGAILPGTHYIKRISMEDSAFNWIEYTAAAPNMNYFFHDHTTNTNVEHAVPATSFVLNNI